MAGCVCRTPAPGAARRPSRTYAGAPNYTFGTLGTNTVLRLSNTLSSQQRRGWSSAATFNGQDFRYEARFNTLTSRPGTSTDGFIELWILDAANTNRLRRHLCLSRAMPALAQALLAGSSIDSSYNTLPYSFQTNTWYRLVLTAPPNQGVRAALLSDAGTELAGVSFPHGRAAFSFGLQDRSLPIHGDLRRASARWMWRWITSA